MQQGAERNEWGGPPVVIGPDGREGEKLSVTLQE